MTLAELSGEYEASAALLRTRIRELRQAIRRETGCAVEQLTMIMDGPDDQLENYYNALLANAKAVINGFAGEELVK